MGVSREDFLSIPRDAYSYEELPVRNAVIAAGFRGLASEDGRNPLRWMRLRCRLQAAVIAPSNRKPPQQDVVSAPHRHRFIGRDHRSFLAVPDRACAERLRP